MYKAMSSILKSVVVLTPIALFGCKQQSTSDVKVTNGLETNSFPAVVSITTGTNGLCTATFIRSDTLLTAAHCAHSGLVIYRGIKSTDIQIHPKYIKTDKVTPYDLAVVKFPKNTAPATAELLIRAPKAGDALTIVGYGNNDTINKKGAGIKRYGTNKIDSLVNGYIKFDGTGYPYALDEAGRAIDPTGLDSISGSGDSGGPLFVDGAIAGVTSGGGQYLDRNKNVLDRGNSSYVDLHSEDSLEFLRKIGLIQGR